jgi:hypothetical protein
MGGTGLEPVTPSLSNQGSVRARSLMFDHTPSLSQMVASPNGRANPSERQSLPSLPRRPHRFLAGGRAARAIRYIRRRATTPLAYGHVAAIER